MVDSSSYKSTQIGYFLQYRHWLDALALLQLQVNQRQKNRHYNKLSIFYYEKVGKSAKSLEDETYFKYIVATSLCYGLENEYAVYPYLLPKKGLGLRHYKFMTYPVRVLYYAIGLYLVELTKEFLEEYYRKRHNIMAFYGAKITFDNKGKLSLNPLNFYYKPYYKEFRSTVISEASENPENKIVLRLDIQNYYDDISIPQLLKHLSSTIKPGDQKRFGFDEATKQLIVDFFRFLMLGKIVGIPQADNDITSNFLGYLYLCFGDLFIEDEIKFHGKMLKSYKIIRYIDDTYISFEFKEETPIEKQRTFIELVSSRISDLLYHNLQLRLNSKFEIFDVSDETQREKLIASLKKVSPDYDLPNDESDETTEEKISKLFTVVKDLKKQKYPYFEYNVELPQAERLKDVFDEDVNGLLGTPKYIKLIQKLFIDFDFELVKAEPFPLIILLTKDNKTKNTFRKFLLSKKILTTKDISLIINFLCQTSFNDPDLFNLLKKNPNMKVIIDEYLDTKIEAEPCGYYKIKKARLLVLVNDCIGNKKVNLSNIVEQIHLRIQSERIKDYSVALNHLLNEFEAICLLRDATAPNAKKYKAPDVVNFLQEQNVSNEICINMRNLFDRRNKNPVSHYGSAGSISWAVVEKEYVDYKTQVGECLRIII